MRVHVEAFAAGLLVSSRVDVHGPQRHTGAVSRGGSGSSPQFLERAWKGLEDNVGMENVMESEGCCGRRE